VSGSPKSQAAGKSHAVDDNGRPICGAKTRSGKPCASDPVRGKRRCRMHGGTNPGRPITHGRYSKAATRMAAATEVAAADTRLADLGRTLAQLQGTADRMAELVDQDDCPEFRDLALKLLNDGNVDGLREHLEAGARETEALMNFGALADKIHQGAVRAWGVKLAATQVINARDLQAMFAQGIDAIQRECIKAEQEQLGQKLVDVLMRLWMPEADRSVQIEVGE
jgi:hypothetical protein